MSELKNELIFAKICDTMTERKISVVICPAGERVGFRIAKTKIEKPLRFRADQRVRMDREVKGRK